MHKTMNIKFTPRTGKKVFGVAAFAAVEFAMFARPLYIVVCAPLMYFIFEKYINDARR